MRCHNRQIPREPFLFDKQQIPRELKSKLGREIPRELKSKLSRGICKKKESRAPPQVERAKDPQTQYKMVLKIILAKVDVLWTMQRSALNHDQ